MYQYPIPNVDQELKKEQGSKCFCDVPFVPGYLQRLLEESSQ